MSRQRSGWKHLRPGFELWTAVPSLALQDRRAVISVGVMLSRNKCSTTTPTPARKGSSAQISSMYVPSIGESVKTPLNWDRNCTFLWWTVTHSRSRPAFNEGTDLQSAVENYLRKFGCYPSAVLADKIYHPRE